MSRWGTFFQILKQVGPIVLAANPATAAIAPVIIHAIDHAEATGQPGADKKAHAMAIVADAVTLAHGAGVAGFEDPAAVLDSTSDGIDTVVGVVHIVEGAKQAV